MRLQLELSFVLGFLRKSNRREKYVEEKKMEIALKA